MYKSMTAKAAKLATEAAAANRQINAVVVSSGLMEKTVKVRVGFQEHNWHIGKDFSRYKSLLVHDPNTSLRTGDIISISPGFRASKHVRHVVSSILAPFGEPIEARPPVPDEEQRWIAAYTKRLAKEERRMQVKQELDQVVAAVVGEEVSGGDDKGNGGRGVQEKQKKKKANNRQTAVLGSRAVKTTNRVNVASKRIQLVKETA